MLRHFTSTTLRSLRIDLSHHRRASVLTQSLLQRQEQQHHKLLRSLASCATTTGRVADITLGNTSRCSHEETLGSWQTIHNRVRPFSSAPAKKKRNPRRQSKAGSTDGVQSSLPAEPVILPTRHSRQLPPPVCTHLPQLQEMTRELLEAPPGSLFAYRTDANTRQDAWDQADAMVQKLEFVMRGHASQLPGTAAWQLVQPSSASSTSSTAPATRQQVQETIRVLESLIDRAWQEGYVYMSLRADRMHEMVRQPVLQDEPLRLLGEDDDEEYDVDFDDMEDDEQKEEVDDMELKGDVGAEMNEDEETPALSLDTEDGRPDDPFFNNFALPGPSVEMFHILMDVLASQVAVCAPQSEDDVCSPHQIGFWMQQVLERHVMDGGDEGNTNPYTVPTIVTYNAPLRLAAEMPYNGANKAVRDMAITVSLTTFTDLKQSDSVWWNANSFRYVLGMIGRFFPTGPTKGHVALAIFDFAREVGVVDDGVVWAFQEANKPSNGVEMKEWITQELGSGGKDTASLPASWSQHVDSRRHPIPDSPY